MIEYHDVTFEGFECLQIKNPRISVWITKDFGPRVIGLSLDDYENLMVVLPEAKIPVEGGTDYSLRGGHRLWYAPEKPETTYLPDDTPVAIEKIPGGVRVIQEPDQPTGIQKSWQIVLDDEAPRCLIEHKLENTSDESFYLAPWAVTMLKPGGIGVIPFNHETSDPNGLWPNRQLAFWPYSDLGSAALKMENEGVFVRANLKEGALKIGAPNPTGWIAYAFQDIIFVKRADYDPDQDYLDRQASSQIYTNQDLIELETLGPAEDLAPAESVTHQEIWELYRKDDWPEEINQVYKSGGFA